MMTDSPRPAAAPKALPSIARRRALSRRTVLRGAGAALALPLLDAMTPAFARAGERQGGNAGPDGGPPRRMVAVNADLGFMPELFFPEADGKGDGKGGELSPYLKRLERHRGRFTALSGVSHREVDGGHHADVSYLTAAPHPKRPGFRNTVSLDQHAAAQLGPVTRFPTLVLRVGPGDGTLSFTDDGTAVPAENRASEVYKRLFVQGSPEEVERQVRRLKDGESLMDAFAQRLGRLQNSLGRTDRDRLDQYLTGVREVERRLVLSAEWERKPKPRVDAPVPNDHLEPGALIGRLRAMYDMTRLALETDSTRLVTILVNQQFNPKVDLPGVETPHHALTHQTSVRESREELRIVEEAELDCLAGLLDGLGAAEEGGGSVLDGTAVIHGSNLGQASRHDNSNLPMLVAGGGFRHRTHLAFDRQHNTPLANLYLSTLHHLGVPAEQFGDSTGTLTGLES